MKTIKTFIFLALFLSYPFFNAVCEVTSHLGYELLLIDNQGRKSGYDMGSGEVLKQIPESTYSEDGLPGLPKYKELDVRTPDKGGYTLFIIGKEDVAYDVVITARDIKCIPEDINIKGSVTTGEIKKVFIDYTPEVGGTTQVFEDNTPPVTTFKTSGAQMNVFGTTYIISSTMLNFESIDPVVGDPRDTHKSKFLV